MGHDISGFTDDDTRIDGPTMGVAWSFDSWHYKYLKAEHHNGGASGDGAIVPVTPELLREAITQLDEDVSGWPGLEARLKPMRDFFEQCLELGVTRIKFW